MKRIIYLFAITMVTISLFSSCSEIDNLLSKEVQLGKKSFRIPVSVEELKADEDFQPFSGTYLNLNLNDPLFGDLTEYRDYPIELKLKSVTVKLNRKQNVTGGTSVMNFNSKASGDGLNYTFSTNKDLVIDISSPYSDDDLKKHLLDIIKAVQNEKTLSIEVKGMTDIIPVEGDQIIGEMEFEMEMSAKVRYLDLL